MMHARRTHGLDQYGRRDARSRRRSALHVRRSIPVVLVVAGILVAMGLAFVYVRQSSALLALTAEREELSETLDATLELNNVFADELAHRHALPIISEIARNQLGMVEPEIVMYIVLQDEQP